MKLSNLWKAWLSTILSIGVGIAGGATTFFVTGSFDKKAFVAFALPIVIGGLTDFLKETQKELNSK